MLKDDLFKQENMKEEIKINKESYSKLAEELKALKAKKFKYNIDKSCGQYGRVEYMTKDNVVSAFAMIKENLAAKKSAATELGLDSSKIKGTGKYNGYTEDEWKADFMTRLEEIKTDKRIEKLKRGCPELLGILDEMDKKAIVLETLNEELNEDED